MLLANKTGSISKVVFLSIFINYKKQGAFINLISHGGDIGFY